MYYSMLIAFRCAVFDGAIDKFSEKPAAHVALYFLETFYVQRNFPFLDPWTSSLIFEYPTLKVRRRPCRST